MTFIRCQRKKRKEIIAHHPKEEDLDHDTEKDQDLQEFDQMLLQKQGVKGHDHAQFLEDLVPN